MIGQIVWWSTQRAQGIAQVVDKDGTVSNYFLLAIHIVRRPQEIRPGQYAKFEDTLPPKRENFLPVALRVIIQAVPLEVTDAGAGALAQKALGGQCKTGHAGSLQNRT